MYSENPLEDGALHLLLSNDQTSLQEEFDYLIINKVEVFTLDGGNCSLHTESPQLI